ncbi:MAG: hypothetical protein GY917_25640, partial [Planctomycetaceae bacterium]|nr:hypothetical protein [Planctomycetaceae bacterium]
MASDVMPLFYRGGNNKSFPGQALTCLDGDVLVYFLAKELQLDTGDMQQRPAHG